MNNTKSSMIDMKPKGVIKLDTVKLDNKYPEQNVIPEDGLYRYLYRPDEQHGDQKKCATDFVWRIRIDWIELYKSHIIACCTICKLDQTELL